MALDRKTRHALVVATGAVFASLLCGFSSPALALGPYWHVDTFNAANLSTLSGNHAMWSGVPAATPGYATPPGYGNGWDDHLYWRGTVVPTQTTTVRLRFVFNHDLQTGGDFLRVENEVAGTWVLRGQTTGTNKNGMGQFVTPATFDQTWVLGPGQYGGPNGDQVVLRLRVLTNGSVSDQDGAYNSSGAVQVDNVQVDLNGSPVSSADFEPSGSNGGWTPYDRQAVADYVKANVLGGVWGDANLWMTQAPLDPTHVVRDGDPNIPDLPMPYPLTWFVVVDTFPNRNWGKPVQWVAVRADLGAHQGPISRSSPGAIHAGGGSGPEVDLDCAGVTPFPCPDVLTPPSIGGGTPGAGLPCRHAVLISGGVDPRADYSTYTTNLVSVYQKLRGLGFEKANIHAFYADGESRDLDDLDGDGEHETGNDLEGAANKTAIRDRIQSLCDELDPRQDVLFIYTTDHGNAGGFLHLWDFDEDDFYDNDERYDPDELGFDTRSCRVCRLFVVMDQCYSGVFIPDLTDGFHENSAIYTASLDDQVTVGREYIGRWEDLDPTTLTMNEMHAQASLAVVWSDPQMGEGTPGMGDFFLDDCGSLETADVTDALAFCQDDASKEAVLVICNLLDEEYSYDVSFAGDPVDVAAGCTLAGPVGFTPLDPLPVAIPARACARIRVRIDRPAGLDALLETACYTATVTNVDRGNTFACHGTVVDRRDLCPRWGEDLAFQFMSMVDPRTAKIRVTAPLGPGPGTALQATRPYRFEVVPAQVTGVAEDAIGLNGGAPGTPVTGVLTLPAPGQSLELPVTLHVAQPDTEFFHVLRFLTDVDGDSQMEVLATMSLRQAGVTTLDAPAPVGVRAGLRVEPNPARGRVGFAFDLARSETGSCWIEVLDLLGRRVRTLSAATEGRSGPQRVTWDARDERGRQVASGVYLVRLVTPGGIRQARAVILH